MDSRRATQHAPPGASGSASEMLVESPPEVLRPHVVLSLAVDRVPHWQFILTGFEFPASAPLIGLGHLRSRTFQLARQEAHESAEVRRLERSNPSISEQVVSSRASATVSEMVVEPLPRILRRHVIAAPAADRAPHWRFVLTGFEFPASAPDLGLSHFSSDEFRSALRLQDESSDKCRFGKVRRLGRVASSPSVCESFDFSEADSPVPNNTDAAVAVNID